jgi:hypothetical protein
MSMVGRRRFLGLSATAVLLAACKTPDASSDALAQLMAPATLVGKLDDVKAGKVLVLQVGPKVLFTKARIPGAEYVGEGSSQSGYDAFAARLAKAPPDVEVVAYCGCCAVADCPNIRPASRAIRESKRTNAWVLDLPTNFATDWERKGHPVEKG